MSRPNRALIISDESLAERFDQCNELDFMARCYRNAYVRVLQGRRASRAEAGRAWRNLAMKMYHILVSEGLVDPYINGEEGDDGKKETSVLRHG